MVEYIDLTGNLTKALDALRDVRRRCLVENWGAVTLTEALALIYFMDQHMAREAGRLKEWTEARERGEEIAKGIITEILKEDLAKKEERP